MAVDVQTRDIIEDDLPLFFEHQLDPQAAEMAGFPSRGREAFMAHWAKILRDETVIKQTILADGAVAGNIVCFMQDGRLEVGYWIGKPYWGKGIATRALAAFLEQVAARPLFAHVVRHNAGSLRVLQKNGFVVVSQDGDEIDLRLDAAIRE